MPVIFVHGVSNRDTPEYRDNVVTRTEFIRALVLPALGLNPEQVQFFNPFWGDDGVTFRWNNASLPDSSTRYESFGAAADPATLSAVVPLVGSDSVAGQDIVAVARRSLEEAIDLLWGAASATVTAPARAADLAQTYAKAVAYAQATPSPPWLKNAKPTNFADLLLDAVKNYQGVTSPGTAVEEEWESFGSGGLLDDIKEGLSRLVNVANAAAGSIATGLARTDLHLKASMFVGDVFTYLTYRGDKSSQGPIVNRVLAAFDDAKKVITTEDPKLIIMGHSLGGVISYDILTYFAPTLEVDAFVTIGSQVGLFEEMTLYKASNKTVPPNPPHDHLARPTNIRRWMNVFDTNDIFSFRVGGIFDGAEDYEYDSGTGILSAHSAYFTRPSFYRRLGERLKAPPK